MILRREYYIKNITQKIEELFKSIKRLNMLGLTDRSVSTENFIRDFFNKIFPDKHLVNLNLQKSNYPTIDLIDEKTNSVYQITASNSSKKIRKTVVSFNKEQSLNFNELYIIILGEKKNYRADFSNNGLFKFSSDNIWDINDILKMINDLKTNQIKEINKFIDEELMKSEVSSLKDPWEHLKYSLRIHSLLKSPTVFHNSSQPYGVEVVDRIFHHSFFEDSIIRIFISDIEHNRIFNSSNLLNKLLVSNPNMEKMKILIGHEGDPKNSEFLKLIKTINLPAEIKIIDSSEVNSLKHNYPENQPEGILSFIVSDNNMLRVEFDKAKPEGQYTFNDPSMAEKLMDFFDLLFNNPNLEENCL